MEIAFYSEKDKAVKPAEELQMSVGVWKEMLQEKLNSF
jgi:hypothetical protein